MKYPGNNSMSLSSEALEQVIRQHAPHILGVDGARITRLQMTGYPARLEINFTTDAEEPPPQPVEPPPRAVAAALPAADDDHPF